MADALAKLFAREPFDMTTAERLALFGPALSELTRHHAAHCEGYGAMIKMLGTDISRDREAQDLPMVPARLFREHDLVSVPRADIAKTLTIGPIGGKPSRIHQSKRCAADQTRALAQTAASFIGGARLPLLVVDTPRVRTDRELNIARGSTIVAFSAFGRDVVYALDDEMELDIGAVRGSFARRKGAKSLIFGWSDIVREYFLGALASSGERLDAGDSILIHAGDDLDLSREARDAGIGDARACWSVAELPGIAFIECEQGHLHCPNFAEVFIRRPRDLSNAEVGEVGFIEIVSPLPTSYPAHALLTEQLGAVVGRDDCPCGRLGSYIETRRADERGRCEA